MFRRVSPEIEVLLAHPGGPFWARKDAGVWTIPKGLVEPGEAPDAAARREFMEETGFVAPGALITLGELVQPSRKRVICFAAEGDADPAGLVSNRISIAWPPRSGRTIMIPEIDRAAWFSTEAARVAILPGQRAFVDRLLDALAS